MSTLSDEFLEAANAAAWVGKTLSVALAYSPSDPWDETYGYDDIAGFLIADGTVGMDWQTIEPISGDFSASASGVASSNYELTFTRDTSGTALQFTHAAVLEPIAGPSWRLVSWQSAGSAGTVINIPAGQIAELTISLGHGR